MLAKIGSNTNANNGFLWFLKNVINFAISLWRVVFHYALSVNTGIETLCSNA
jgi:hypothetical protein